jgi:hypothetical protein
MLMLSIERNSAMNRMITALTVFTVSLGTAAYAETPTNSSQAQILPTPGSASPATTQTYASQNTLFSRLGRANNPSVPGATGYTIVPGDNSSVAGDGAATEMERTGAYGN